MWRTNQPEPLTVASLRELARGDIPAIRVSEFATEAECEALAASLLEHSIRTHSVVEVTRLGISQYQQGVRGSKKAYFDQAAALQPTLHEIFACSFDATERLLDCLRSLGIDAAVMTETGFGPYWPGSGKLRNGDTPLHVDFAPQDSQGWEIAQTISQFAWNLYLQVPTPGAVQLWDREWVPDDEIHQAEAAYYYDQLVARDADAVEIDPVVGEVLILNSRYYHSVAPTTDRLTFGSFISIFGDDTVRVWA